jgi:hypothetical protein
MIPPRVSAQFRSILQEELAGEEQIPGWKAFKANHEGAFKSLVEVAKANNIDEATMQQAMSVRIRNMRRHAKKTATTAAATPVAPTTDGPVDAIAGASADATLP